MLKTKLFYSHLISLKDLEKEIARLKLSPIETEEIIFLVEDILHHRILTSLLEIIPQNHHETVISRFTQSPSNLELLEFIKSVASTDPEVKILSISQITKRDILFDIAQTHPQKRRK